MLRKLLDGILGISGKIEIGYSTRFALISLTSPAASSSVRWAARLSAAMNGTNGYAHRRVNFRACTSTDPVPACGHHSRLAPARQ